MDGAEVRVLAATAGVLVVVALGACVMPSRRATLVDPITTLRVD